MCNMEQLYGIFGFFFFQAEDGIRDLVRSRGLGDVYKRQGLRNLSSREKWSDRHLQKGVEPSRIPPLSRRLYPCLLYTSDAADERSSVDLGGRRIIKKKTKKKIAMSPVIK